MLVVNNPEKLPEMHRGLPTINEINQMNIIKGHLLIGKFSRVDLLLLYMKLGNSFSKALGNRIYIVDCVIELC